MPTKRSNATAICTVNKLIVAGGEGRCERVLETVEVMDTATYQWYTATSLPEPLWRSSATVTEGRLCMLGGINHNWNATHAVYTCLPDVVTFPTREAEFVNIAWEKLTDLPVTNSTCTSLCNQLLAVGGCKETQPVTSVYQYDFDTNAWKVISNMGCARYDCFAVIIPGDQLMVVGGDNHDNFSLSLDSFARGIPDVEFAYI